MKGDVRAAARQNQGGGDRNSRPCQIAGTDGRAGVQQIGQRFRVSRTQAAEFKLDIRGTLRYFDPFQRLGRKDPQQEGAQEKKDSFQRNRLLLPFSVRHVRVDPGAVSDAE